MFWPKIENCREINLMASAWPGESDMTCVLVVAIRNTGSPVLQFTHRDQLARRSRAIDAGKRTAIAA
jgi:hypothetical protein